MTKKPVSLAFSLLGGLLLLVLLVNLAIYGGMKHFFPDASLTGHYPPAEQNERDNAIPVKTVNTKANVPAQQVVSSIMSKTFSAVKGWDGGQPNVSTPNSIFSWVCGDIKGKNLPYPMVANVKSYSHSGRKNMATVLAYAYGAGAGKTAVEKLKEQASSCKGGSAGITSSQVPQSGANGGFTAYYSSGGNRINVNVWALGDVVLTVASNSSSTLSALSNEYDSYARGLLSPLCLSLKDSTSDVTRNPYVSGDAYTGWNKGRVVNLNRNIPGLNPGYISLDEPIKGKGYALGNVPGEKAVPMVTHIPAETLSYEKVSVPEPPLEPYPRILPKAVDEPKDKPKAIKVPEVSTTVAERVKDAQGPGCGWAFTGQSAPLFDDTKEKKAADDREAQAQSKLQGDQTSYYGDVADYVLAYEDYARSVYLYEDYSKKVDKVRDQWQDITDKRDAYRRKLDQYYQDIKDRKSFASRQKEAQKQYDKDKAVCEDYNAKMDQYRSDYAKDKERYDREVEAWRRKKEQDQTPVQPEPDPTSTAVPTVEPAPDYSGVTPPADEVKPPGEGLTKPDKPSACPLKRPSILDESMPPVPTPPKKPDVELPYAWDDIPDEG